VTGTHVKQLLIVYIATIEDFRQTLWQFLLERTSKLEFEKMFQWGYSILAAAHFMLAWAPKTIWLPWPPRGSVCYNSPFRVVLAGVHISASRSKLQILGSVYNTPEEYTLKTHQMFSAGGSWKRNNNRFFLDLWLRKTQTGEHHEYRNVIASEKLRF